MLPKTGDLAIYRAPAFTWLPPNPSIVQALILDFVNRTHCYERGSRCFAFLMNRNYPYAYYKSSSLGPRPEHCLSVNKNPLRTQVLL